MFSLNCKGKFVSLEKPLVMGILNITDNSFYVTSRLQNEKDILHKAIQMVDEGVDILDIGAQSTRPGSERIGAEEELEKLLPVIKKLVELFPCILLSIDTYHAHVAANSVKEGAHIINDISGGEMDNKMISTVGKLHVPYICMHIKGVPETMQNNTGYENISLEILDFFIRKIAQCEEAGIHDVIIDPGFGFGKNIEQNLLLLKNLTVFKMLKKPIMAGLSRKSTIYKTLGVSAEEALNGTTVLHTLALQNGANILRVHDVKQARETIKIMTAYGKA